jgi:8-hydroxy-5-deazaflavin:NADPH oxidoreductase
MCTDLAAELSGCIAVSVASPIVFRDGRPAAAPGELSLAELAQQAAPRAHVVAALHTVSAKLLAKADEPLDEDVLVCADDEDAKTVVCDVLDRIVAGRVVDCGRLEVARWIEPLTAVLLNVNRRYKANTGIRVTGIR